MEAQSFPSHFNKLKTCLRVTLTFSFVSPLRSQNDSNPVVEVAVGHLAGCLIGPKPLPETLTFWTTREIAASALERFFRGFKFKTNRVGNQGNFTSKTRRLTRLALISLVIM